MKPMQDREITQPRDEAHWLELRVHDVTTTQTSALFDCNPYMTAFELNQAHLGNYEVEFEENERTKWGSRLESSIAEGIAEERNWHIRPMKEYIRDPHFRMGGSFDFRVQRGVKDSVIIDSDDDFILEIKNVDNLVFRDTWIVNEDKTIEAPPHIEIQVQQQLYLSKLKKAYIGVLVGGNKLYIIEREADPTMHIGMQQAVSKHFKFVEAGTSIQPNWEQDADVVAKIYGYAEPGSLVHVGDDEQFGALAAQYKEYGAAEKSAKTAKKGIKAKLLTLMGDAEKALGANFTVSSKMIGPTTVETYLRKGYRDFRINFKKAKAS